MDAQQRLLLECTEEALVAARLSVQGAVAGELWDLPGRDLLVMQMLRCGRHAACEARMPPDRLLPLPAAAAAGGLVGVFVGISTPDYSQVAQAHADVSAYSATGQRGGARWQCLCSACALRHSAHLLQVRSPLPNAPNVQALRSAWRRAA